MNYDAVIESKNVQCKLVFKQLLNVFITRNNPNELKGLEEKKKILDRHHFSHSVVPLIQRNKLVVGIHLKIKGELHDDKVRSCYLESVQLEN